MAAGPRTCLDSREGGGFVRPGRSRGDLAIMSSRSSRAGTWTLTLGAALFAGALAATSRLTEAAPRLKSKECLSCHAPVQKQQARKFVHEPFKDGKACETCHRRHGVV